MNVSEDIEIAWSKIVRRKTGGRHSKRNSSQIDSEHGNAPTSRHRTWFYSIVATVRARLVVVCYQERFRLRMLRS